MQPKHNFSVFNNLKETEKFTQAFAANFSFFLYCIWLMNYQVWYKFENVITETERNCS